MLKRGMSIDALKQLLINPPVLGYPHPSDYTRSFDDPNKGGNILITNTPYENRMLFHVYTQGNRKIKHTETKVTSCKSALQK